MRRRQSEPFIGSLDWILRHYLGVRKRCAHQLTEKQRMGMASRSNSKHWFTTSFLPWRKVPESDARSVLRGLTKAGQSVSETSSRVRVYQYDPETKQQSSVRLSFSHTRAHLVKFKRLRSICKQMITVFFAKSGHSASDPLQKRKTVNSERYVVVISACLMSSRLGAHAVQTPTGTRGCCCRPPLMTMH